MLYPLLFHPVYKERIWGGRRLAEHFGRALPPDVPVGESWEIADRPDTVSVIANGPLAGKTLRWLMEHHAPALLGTAPALNGRFPLLVKILDARTALSVQVHPPAHVAPALKGEPKTEAWHVIHAEPGACIHAGLREPVTRQTFAAAIQQGCVTELIHTLPVQAGDSLFLPSGRVHALGGGVMVFEVQQNSDTTYRVFDWNRTGPNCQPRKLHIEQSLASIQFDDVRPALSPPQPAVPHQIIAEASGLFYMHLHRVAPNTMWTSPRPGLSIVGVCTGTLTLECAASGQPALSLVPGQFALLPAQLAATQITATAPATFITAGVA